MDRLFLLFFFVASFSTARCLPSEDNTDHIDYQRLPPLARHFVRAPDPSDSPQTSTTKETAGGPGVTTLTEAITLAVMSGICGPSLFVLIACGIRQIRLTWDDPFAGGKRPTDPSAARRKQRRSVDDDDDEQGSYADDNSDPLNLDRAVTLDLDKIRAKFSPTSAKENNNDKANVNKGYSKTAEDIL
ncbi:uncharacterized protein [Asterias amurensis]|uniref:uncharacterized protein n=1 Tax=Asterias amurensis TaxID=7602 RepID=UPI003AB43D30